MEHAEETDLGSQVAWIASDLKQSLSTGVKEKVVDQPFILQCERSQFPRQGEYNVHVAGRQQLPFPRMEPAQARIALTLGAVPVSARVVRDDGMSAVRALIAMSAQRGGAAARDGQQHFFVLGVDPPATAFNEGLSCTANDVGHLQRRPVHALCVGSPSPSDGECIERTAGGAEMPPGQMQIESWFPPGRDVPSSIWMVRRSAPAFEQVRSKAVAQSVGMDVLVLKAGAFGRPADRTCQRTFGGDRVTRRMPSIAGEQPVGGLALQPAPVDA